MFAMKHVPEGAREFFVSSRLSVRNAGVAENNREPARDGTTGHAAYRMGKAQSAERT